MSWSLSATGHINRVRHIIKNQAFNRWNEGATDENTQQHQAAAQFIEQQLLGLRDCHNANAVRVEASGHLHAGAGNLRIEITPLFVHLNEPGNPAAEVETGLLDRAIEAVGNVAAVPALQAVLAPAPAPCPDCGQTEHSRGCPKF